MPSTPNCQILLTQSEVENLASQVVNELHLIPLYDTSRKKKLLADYTIKIQNLIIANIIDFCDNNPDGLLNTIRGRLLQDEFEHGLA